MKDPLKCYACDETFATIPKLKEHLEADFQKLKKKALADSGSNTKKRKLDNTQADATSEDKEKGSEKPDGGKESKMRKVSSERKQS